MITIIDYGMGNLRSVQKIFHRLNVPAQITSDLKLISAASKLLLPGVGNFANGMKKLTETGIKEIIDRKVLTEKVPILGICLGMQLMTNYSEEGDVEGLGWVDAGTYKFNFSNRELKIPHMGWNDVTIKKKTHLSQFIGPNDAFYFVHSYFVKCKKQDDILFETIYGQPFVSGFERENIIGVQFHPEKSHQSGMSLIKNFSTIR